MHFFAQLKPKSYIAIMWVSHGRRSAELDGVLFKRNDDGIFESDELTDEQIDRFRTRPEHVKLIAMSILPDIEELPKTPKKRVRLEE